ncbi:9432_t:CDS:2 [Paraglomus occultum]|uniref:Protein BCP1 n=1 Tax=Paraglomus occultum TaxID=144539 RepID=A0A9N9F514_9GLOM|nr:9432_t:CDS:2 [Paraglomus occultum]
MTKRKRQNKSTVDDDNKEDQMDISDDETSDEELEDLTVDTEFEFFDPQKQDFHGIKRLLTQLFSSDAKLFDLSELTEIILDQPLLGSTVKIDGEGAQGDPYALFTVLNLGVHKERSIFKQLRKYLLEKSKEDEQVQKKLDELLQSDNAGIVFSERVINMPVGIVPPMYKMLIEEIQWAVDENEPYKFDWYLILSRTFKEIESTLGSESSGNKKKKKKKPDTLSYFHPEDEIIEQNSDFIFDFKFTQQQASSDSKRTFYDFGVSTAMRLFILRGDKLQAVADELEKACQ